MRKGSDHIFQDTAVQITRRSNKEKEKTERTLQLAPSTLGNLKKSHRILPPLAQDPRRRRSRRTTSRRRGDAATRCRMVATSIRRKQQNLRTMKDHDPSASTPASSDPPADAAPPRPTTIAPPLDPAPLATTAGRSRRFEEVHHHHLQQDGPPASTQSSPRHRGRPEEQRQRLTPDAPDCSGIVKTRDLEHFWPFSWAIVHSFQIGRASCRERVYVLV